MSDHESRLSRPEAERLLDAPAAHDSALGWVLSTVRAPAHPGELRREDAEVAAFHQARSSPPPAGRRSFVSPTRLGSRAAVHAVVATGAVVAMASGGFALAGSIDLLSPPGRASDRATEAVSATTRPTESIKTAETAGTDSPTASTESGEPVSPTESVETGASGESVLPTPHLTGLCTAFQAVDRSSGGSLDSAAFSALAAAAGGSDEATITTYCVRLIGEPKETGRPSELPTPTTGPSPTGKPSVVPTPTDKPSPSKPSPDKPSTGKPTDTPEQSGKGGGKDSTTSGS